VHSNDPPRFATWLLERLASGQTRDPLIGDLLEQYASGRSAAWYWRQTLAAILSGTMDEVRNHKRLAIRAVMTGFGSIWSFWALTWILTQIIWVLSSGGLYIGGHWIRLDYHWVHYRIYLALLLTVFGCAASGWIVARLHRHHQQSMVLVFLMAVVLASIVQVAVRVRLVGWPIRPLLMQTALAAVVSLVVAPISILIGGLWTNYGTRTTGARQNATF
jgi:hypothetical protein